MPKKGVVPVNKGNHKVIVPNESQDNNALKNRQLTRKKRRIRPLGISNIWWYFQLKYERHKTLVRGWDCLSCQWSLKDFAQDSWHYQDSALSVILLAINFFQWKECVISRKVRALTHSPLYLAHYILRREFFISETFRTHASSLPLRNIPGMHIAAF